MFNVDPNDPTLPEAMEQLTKAEAADAAEAGQQQAPETGSADPAERAGDKDQQQVPPSEPKPDPGASATEDPTKPSTEQKPEDKGKSKFAQANARLEGGFTKLREEKSAFEKERLTFQAEREEVAKQRKALETERAQASQPKYKPEDYENHAANLEREAEACDAKGDFDQAVIKRHEASKHKAYAKELRDNPPKPAPTDEEAQASFLKAQKEWMSKALTDFPRVGDKNSDEAKAYAALIKNEPKIMEDPKLLYFAARLVCAETSAAAVPAKDKELDGLRAKVKELETKLTIPGDVVTINQAGRKPVSEQTDEELESELRREAEASGPGRY